MNARALWYAWIVLFFCWLWFALSVLHGSDTFSALAVVNPQTTYDFNGVQFYELKMKGGSATIAADADTELAKYLAHSGPKVRMTLEAYELETITR